MDRWEDRWTNGLVNRWLGGQMNGWVDQLINDQLGVQMARVLLLLLVMIIKTPIIY